MDNLDEIQESFPFLSGIKYQDKEYVCIIQNSDEKILSFYDINAIKTENEKKLFLKYGDIWYWESNRLLPISIFMHEEMKKFRYCLRTIPVKDTEILFGPVTSLSNLVKKRVKRRQIKLMQKPK